jgi:nucleoside 2-deoxyribosyltransferase
MRMTPAVIACDFEDHDRTTDLQAAAFLNQNILRMRQTAVFMLDPQDYFLPIGRITFNPGRKRPFFVYISHSFILLLLSNSFQQLRKNTIVRLMTWLVLLRTVKKIYFACSIRGGRDDAETYAKLVQHIKTRANVLTEIFADGKLTSQGMNMPSSEIWAKDTAWVKEADAIIAEVSNPSLGVGYEIAKAEEMGKPVLALFRDGGTRKLSAMIDGSPGVTNKTYTTIEEACSFIDEFVLSI